MKRLARERDEGDRLVGGDDAVHALVVGACRYLVDEFGVEQDSEHGRPGCQGRERLVEVAASPTEAHAGAVHGSGRHDHEVDLVDGCRAERLADLFGNTERAGDELGIRNCDGPVEQTVVADNGKKHPDVAGSGIPHELPRAGFFGRGQEARHRARAESVDQRVEAYVQLLGSGIPIHARHRPTPRAYVGAQSTFRGRGGVKHGFDCRRDRLAGMPPTKPFKAVIPAAGLGTRFLPATKAMPKEMLPVVDKPAIQYVVEEAAAAGIEDVLIITGRNKHNIANHFDAVPELEAKLEEKGDLDRLARTRESSDLADIHVVRQGDPKGLGHAVLRAQRHVDDHPFVVMLGDDLIDERDPLITTMMAEHERTGASVIALMEVDPDHIHMYGAAAVEATDRDDVVRVTGLVEKPPREEAPSNLAVIGRYVLGPEVFDVLERTEPGKGGEIQLTDALQELAADQDGPGVYGVIFRGRRYDTGDRLDYIKAIVQLAADRHDLGPDLRPWFKDFAATL